MKEIEFSDLDRRILDRLAVDARQSNREIARELGVAEGTIRLRLKRLLEEDAIEVLAITSYDQGAEPLVAYLWITVEASHPFEEVLAALVAQPEITYVASLIGRADILAITWVKDANELANYLHNTIDQIAGVGTLRYEIAHRLIKHDYRITNIVH
jgi:Lrp/AsnC family transcriptional regulator, regulator for asnA, asnC and gidA